VVTAGEEFVGDRKKRKTKLLLQVHGLQAMCNRDGGGVRGMAAPAYPGGLGFPDPPESPWRSDSPPRTTGSVTASVIRVPEPRKIRRESGVVETEEIGVQLTEGFMMDRRRASVPWCFTIRIELLLGEAMPAKNERNLKRQQSG